MTANKPRYPLINAKVRELITRSRVLKAPVPVASIAELCGARVVENKFDGEISGVLIRKPGNIVIGVEKTQSEQRQRFTIAHELGHLLLHEGAEVHFDRNFRVNLRSPVSSKAEDIAEIEANAFAASLLMPISFLLSDLRDKTIDLENEVQIGQLADRYKVSSQAMTYRLISIFSAPRTRS